MPIALNAAQMKLRSIHAPRMVVCFGIGVIALSKKKFTVPSYFGVPITCKYFTVCLRLENLIFPTASRKHAICLFG